MYSMRFDSIHVPQSLLMSPVNGYVLLGLYNWRWTYVEGPFVYGYNTFNIHLYIFQLL